MKTKTIITACLLGISIIAGAQTVYKIDINEWSRTNMDEVLEPGFTPWRFEKDTYTSQLDMGDGVTFVIRSESNMRGGWNKAFVQKKDNNSRLTGDGVNLDPNECGSFDLVIKGLTPGSHNIQTFHNGWGDPSNTVGWPITISLNGQVVHQSVPRTLQVGSMNEATVVMTEFTVGSTDEEVVITVSTSDDNAPADAGTKKNSDRTPLLNGFMIDVANSALQAKLPVPADRDIHVDADDGELQLCWSPANESVTTHYLYIGTDSIAVAQADTSSPLFAGAKEKQDTTHILSSLYSMNMYYWRVDEVFADGTVAKGDTWQFQPRHLAFPGAEGYGRFARGGRGGVVYHVTSLSGGKEPGTLLYGLVEMSGPRYIVFDVSGTIELNFSAYFTKPYAYIAGQTAPGRGICIKHSNINIGSETICRHMRFKRGYGDTGNALGMTGADHSIVDHTTAAWGTDETFSSRGAKNITFQYSMIAEALGIADHKNYATGTNHGYAATIGGERGTFSHNLLVNCAGRNWSMGGGLDGDGKAAGELDMMNNVCYNWYSRTTDGGAKWMQFVNNYYKMGPDTRLTNLFSADNEGGGHRAQFAYVSGNIRENKNHTLTNDKINVTYRATGDYPGETWYDEPFFPSYATLHSAADAMKIVTSDAGATMPCRDGQHVRVVGETVNGTYTFVGSRSGIKGEIDHEDDQGGWENYPEEHRPADWDTDQDGMPDWYEQCIGSNADVPNQNDDPDGDGYTLLEDYLDFMAHPYLIIAPGGEGSIDLREHFIGFFGQNGNSVMPTFSLDEDTASGSFAPSISGTVLTVRATKPDTQSVGTINITVSDGETSFTQHFGVAITGNTNSISQISTLNSQTSILYNLSGQRISQPQKGIYVQNGRKIVIR